MERNEKISKLIETAKSLLGTPYKYGAYSNPEITPKEGVDCSSFIQYVFKQSGIELPRSSILQAAFPGEEISDINNAQLGDLIFFESDMGHYNHGLFPGRKIYVGHLGIYLGNDEIIHASNNEKAHAVVIQKISELQNLHPEFYKVTLIKRFM